MGGKRCGKSSKRRRNKRKLSNGSFEKKKVGLVFAATRERFPLGE